MVGVILIDYGYYSVVNSEEDASSGKDQLASNKIDAYTEKWGLSNFA